MTIVSTAEPNIEAGPPDWWLRYHGIGRQRTEDRGQTAAEMVFVPCSILRRTEKGIQCRHRYGDGWLPISQVTEVDGGIQIPRWLAEKNDLVR